MSDASTTVAPSLPRRHIHLDFHTGPGIPDVGTDFDPSTFAEPFVEAGVDAVTLFAKCHHGHLYFDTDHPARHPGLPAGLDLLAEQREALRAVGIKTPIYLSVQCDEYAANTHPEWVALGPDLRQVKRASSAFEAGWQILDMSSPYQDYFADQLDEVLRRFAPVDGIFLDMCWDQPSVSRWAVDGMRKAGLDPTDPEHRSRYARMVAHRYMARYRDMVRAANARSQPATIFFNSRPRTLAPHEREFATHVEIEALPTGGWGYSYTPFIGRFVRACGLPAFGMTGRFHRSWGDNAGYKPAAALKYEACQLLSLGFGVSVGDVLHPRGAPDRAAYRLIGDVYRHLRACEPFVVDGEIRTEVAILVSQGPELDHAPDDAQIGAVRALQQLRHQFDVTTPDARLDRYRVLVVPESTRLDAAGRRALADYLHAGGSALVVGAACADGTAPILPELGVEALEESPYTHTFLRLTDPLRDLAGSVSDRDTVVYERGLRLRPSATATTLATVVEPYFERSYDNFCGHSYTPPDRETDHAAIVENAVGRGRVITVAEPLLYAFARHGYVAYREVLGACLRRLLPDPLLRAGGPAHLETSVVDRGDTRVVHLLSFLPSRQGDRLDLVTDPFPLVDCELAIRWDGPTPRVTLQPHGQELPASWEDGYVRTTVTLVDGHGLVVVSPR
ncbi:alpha-amylase family protein [Thermasporomyces composti]|jgi:hypothetical protein|uniref:Beta-galactosidase-like protein n=1 Tax=Thermasporomyces composti TaxID=696763 RepID=A0A3D9V6P2_THECX|nr:alpha-amylase family protein [Thermasporomyces composti]REF36996.1 beta-galactosidase-like protein [Thermasporomyces composti]